jgi:hypothetical protein
VLSLPLGEERDAMLYSMISAAFITSTEPGDSLFRAYSSDGALQVAAVNAARTLAERDNEEAARRMLNRYVKNPDPRLLYANGEPLPSPN